MVGEGAQGTEGSVRTVLTKHQMSPRWLVATIGGA